MPNRKIREPAAISGTEFLTERFFSLNRHRRMAIKKERTIATLPRRGTFPEWIFREFTKSYRLYALQNRITSGTKAMHKRKASTAKIDMEQIKRSAPPPIYNTIK